MSPDVPEAPTLEKDAVTMLPEGGKCLVIPDVGFSNVELDWTFTGAASRADEGPYFSQLENLRDMVQIYTDYAPPPVVRMVFIRFADAVALALTDELAVGSGAVGSIKEAGTRRRGLMKTVADALEAPARTRHRKGRRRFEAIERPVGQTTERLIDVFERAEEPATHALELAELTAQLRDFVDLPVQDIARMCGVGRRQYYNLLNGSTRTTAEEQHIRLLHRMLSELYTGLGADEELVRAAVLLPLESAELRSFHEEASTGDDERMQHAFIEVKERLRDATTEPRRIPPSGTLPPDDPTWAEAADFLRGYPAPDEDSTS